MAKEDEEKTSFHTNQGVYCYTKIPFGLKNAGATYQRLVDSAFEGQVGRNLEVYIDDLVIKIHTKDELVRDIEETFRTLRMVNMKLNPKKCTFGATEGMFLGYLIEPDGIKPCPEKTKAVIQIPSPRMMKEILADFIIEKPDTNVAPPRSKVKLHKPWILFTDRSSCMDRSGTCLILTNPERMEFTYALRIEFTATNNEVEYEALIAGLRIATRMGTRNLEENVDSRLVANHVLGEYVAKEDNMVQYLDKTKLLIQGFDRFTIKQVPRSENKKADALSKIASTSFAHLSKQADYVLREIHAGSCSMHLGPRSIVARALRSGYYWPTMHRDARDVIKKCSDCQVYRPIPRQPQQQLTPITSPWPFYKWVIDIAGPFPVAVGGLKFLIVAIDYFTKWIEAKVVATITVKHLQTNSLVERANRSLGERIKARLDKHKGRWVEELSHVLWAHRTTIKVRTGDTPFSLVYETEAVIQAEIGMPTIRTAEVNVATNDDERRIDLDLLEKGANGYYDAKVRGVSFRPGDFVYRANAASHAEDAGKLGPKWEGPYEVNEALGNATDSTD
nr:reverse transcriptase domain-containing protein [Tanacetum cinerariifolium]